MADAAGAKEQPGDKPSEVAPARVKSGVRKCSGIHVSKHVSGERRRQRDRKQHRRDGSVAPERAPWGVRSENPSQGGTF